MSSSRRAFLSASARAAAGYAVLQLPGAPAFFGGAARAAGALTSRQRVERALAGQEVDRPPFSLWHHFGLEKDGPARHAQATLAFHRQFGTDLVKVMSDFPYPKPASGAWFELREESNPFPAQLQALDDIRQGLAGEALFVETIFNPWNVAEKLSSPEEVQRLRKEQPQRLLDALAIIAKSEANHARRALTAGASGIFLAIANAQPEFLTDEEYAKFSEPFDRVVLDAVKGAPLNILHLHGDHVYLDRFYSGWPAARAINYSAHGTGVSIETVRKKYSGVLMGGIDEVHYRTLEESTVRAQYEAARAQAGAKFVLAPGCSVPNDTSPQELSRLKALFPA
jgi:uroporphyrinogen decarboxylase